MGDEYLLQLPRKQLFYRVLSTLMSYSYGGSPLWWGYDYHNMFFHFHSFLILGCIPLIFGSQILYAVINFSRLTFEVVGIIFAIIPVTFLVVISCICCSRKRYRLLMKDFMIKIHLHNYQDQHKLAQSKLIIIEKYSRYSTYFLFSFLAVGGCAWSIVTTAHNINNMEQIRNKTEPLQTVLYMLMPFDYEYNIRNWIVVHTLNSYLSLVGCCVIMVFNTINFIFVFHLIGHIQIMKLKMSELYSGTRSDDEDKKSLVGIIKYHAFIMQVFNDIQDVFGLNVAANYFFNLIADSLMLYQMVVGDKGNKILYGLMLVAYVGALVLMSFILEQIRRESDNLSDLFYNIQWETMSLSNQKMVMLILFRMQPPLVFTASGGLMTGVRPMISILKSTFSYYVMLKSSI